MREKKDLWKNKKLCGQFVREMPEITDDLIRIEKLFEHAPEDVAENKEVKILQNVMVECDRKIKPIKPDKNERSCAIIDIAIPGDIRVTAKEKEKTERHQELKREIKRM